MLSQWQQRMSGTHREEFKKRKDGMLKAAEAALAKQNDRMDVLLAQQSTADEGEWQKSFNKTMLAMRKAEEVLSSVRKLGVQEKPKPHELPATITKIPITNETTKTALKNALIRYEGEMLSKGTPQMQGGRCRWADGLLRVFEEGPLSAGHIEWVRDNLVQIEDQPVWETIKDMFVDKFKRAHDKYESIRPIARQMLLQGEQDVATHYHEFQKRVVASLVSTATTPEGRAIEANWGESHPVYAVLFISSLRDPLRRALVKDSDFKAASEKGLQAVVDLASEVEEGRRSVRLFETNAGATGGGSRSSAGQVGRKRKQQAVFGGKSASLPACARCGRLHLGGESNCFAKKHANGQLITTAPTAEEPAPKKKRLNLNTSKPQERERKCYACQAVGHIAKNCPVMPIAKKVARVMRDDEHKREPMGGDNNESRERFGDRQTCILCGSADHRTRGCNHLSTAQQLLKKQE